MKIALITIAAFVFGVLVGFVVGFRFADYLNERQEREREQGGGR
jgi:hypothetical protein